MGLEFSESDERMLFEALAEQSKSRLAETALNHGVRLYHGRPGLFCDALGCYWDTWTRQPEW